MTRRHRSFRRCGCSRIDWADGQNEKMNGHKVENCWIMRLIESCHLHCHIDGVWLILAFSFHTPFISESWTVRKTLLFLKKITSYNEINSTKKNWFLLWETRLKKKDKYQFNVERFLILFSKVLYKWNDRAVQRCQMTLRTSCALES